MPISCARCAGQAQGARRRGCWALTSRRRAGYAVFQPRFDQLDALAGTHVEVIDQGRTIQGGIACGTDPEGRLMLSTPQGRFPVLVGDVSVRPQSGGGKRQS